MAEESQTPTIERRRHARYDLFAQVRVKKGRVDYVLELSNISQSGALVHLGSLKKPKWVAVGRIVQLAIINPKTLKTVKIKGRVVRVVKRDKAVAFGLEFEKLDKPAKAGIRGLIKLGTPQPVPPPLPKRPTAKPPPLPKTEPPTPEDE